MTMNVGLATIEETAVKQESVYVKEELVDEENRKYYLVEKEPLKIKVNTATYGEVDSFTGEWEKEQQPMDHSSIGLLEDPLINRESPIELSVLQPRAARHEDNLTSQQLKTIHFSDANTGQTHSLLVPQEEAKLILEDQDYARKVFLNYFNPSEATIGHQNTMTLKPIIEKTEVPLVWNKETTNLLLSRVHDQKDAFKTRAERHRVFSRTAEAFVAQGFSASLELVGKKWNSLVTTFRRNAQKSTRSGPQAVTWEYFEQMVEILGKGELDAPKDVLQISNPSTTDSNTESNEASSFPPSTIPTTTTTPLKLTPPTSPFSHTTTYIPSPLRTPGDSPSLTPHNSSSPLSGGLPPTKRRKGECGKWGEDGEEEKERRCSRVSEELMEMVQLNQVAWKEINSNLVRFETNSENRHREFMHKLDLLIQCFDKRKQ